MTFDAGETSKDIVVQVVGDAVSERDEQFRIALAETSLGTTVAIPQGYKAARSFFTITNDDQDRITMTVDAASKSEGNPATDGDWLPYTVTLTRENPQLATETVHWEVAGAGTHALDVSRFETTSGTASFVAGALTTSFDIRVSRDALGDYDRTFELLLTDPLTSDLMGATIVNNSQTFTVVNDDPTLAVAFAGTKAFREGTGAVGGLVEFTIARGGNSDEPASVDWNIEGDGTGTSANLSDFGGYYPSGRVNFAVGETQKTVRFRLSGDALYEATEGFHIVLSNAAGAQILEGQGEDTATIVNDDNGVFVSTMTTSLVEGDSGTTPVTFTISAQGVPGRQVIVHYTIEGTGTAPANADDFASGWGEGSVTLTIGGNGTASTDVTVNVNGDTQSGVDESFRLRVTSVERGSVGQLADGQASVMIVNDDSLAGIVAVTAEQPEGGSGSETVYHYTVTRTGDLSRESVVDYHVEGLGDSQATGADFLGGVLPQGTITFAAGVDTFDLAITVVGNDDFESDKGFAVRLTQASSVGVDANSNPQNAAAIDPGAALALSTIVNDDATGIVVNGLVTTVTEGNDPSAPHALSYEIIRNGDASKALTVTYVLGKLDLDGVTFTPYDPNATPLDADALAVFNALGTLNGSIELAAGESRKVLNLQVAPNSTPGSDLQFALKAITGSLQTLSSPVSSKVLDDDSGITIRVVNANQTEDLEGVSTVYDFVIERAGSNLGATNVQWTLAGIGANPADLLTDFADDQALSGTVEFADYANAVTGDEQAAALSQTLHIKVRGDAIVEPNEAFRVNLVSSSDTSQKIQVASADAVIVNNDAVTTGDDVIDGASTTNYLNGLAGNDEIHGGQASDMMFGGDGNDVLYGGGGADQMYGGAGDDTLVIGEANLPYLTPQTGVKLTLDGGAGTDTLKLEGSGLELDLTGLQAQINSIEKINIDSNGGAINKLVIDQAFLSRQAMNLFNVDGDLNVRDEYHQLLVDGAAGDEVIIDLTDWTQAGTYQDGQYNVWVNQNLQSELLVKVGVDIHNPVV